MYEWVSFDAVFRQKPDFSLDNKRIDSISHERKEFGGILFFDRIWSSIGLKQPQKVYPPKSNSELRALWSKVVSTDVSDEKKQAVLLYVLRDCTSNKTPHIDIAFAKKTYLPLKYRILIDGLWELDHAHFPRALEHLTDPTLSADFSDDILLALIRSAKCDNELAMSYYITVSPPLAKQETMDAYFGLLVNTNLVEAYHFAQKQGNTRHRLLFAAILRSVLGDNGRNRASRANLLLGLPFTKQEENWFEEYLVDDEGKDLPGAQDSIMARSLATGHPTGAFQALTGYRGKKVDGMDWEDIRLMHQTAVLDG